MKFKIQNNYYNDYAGCRNCEHQPEPLNMCERGKNGGDGHIHLCCPKWELKRKGENRNDYKV